MVERNLAKVEVAGSNPVFRSTRLSTDPRHRGSSYRPAGDRITPSFPWVLQGSSGQLGVFLQCQVPTVNL